MRRWIAIARATALEMLSEPLSLLLLLAALTLSVLAPAFHYHQFGEATRMARDAGFSALFTCGSALAVFGTIRSFRRELESGTFEMALAHPLSRPGFFVAKCIGSFAAYLLFALVVFLTTVLIVNGAVLGGRLAQKTGDIARLWGPSLALGVGTIVLPLVVAAALNRFAHFRFVLTSVFLALLGSGLALLYRFDGGLVGRLLPVGVLLVMPALLLLVASAAFSMRYRANGAAAGAGLLFVAFLPFAGNYYLVDALSRGGSLPWSYVAQAGAFIVPAVLAFLLLGSHWTSRHE